MEEQLRDIESASFQKNHLQYLFDGLSESISEAAEIRDEELVNDPSLRRALSIVEIFLRRTGRVCYGGMAINAHLPKTLKFYDFSKTLPDYDFFTPEPEKDIKQLLEALKKEGFDSVSARLGIHKGTHKIFVNYNAVADVTYCPLWLYSSIKKNAIKEDGITYADSSFLRMNMYLELSRPRGEVERWEKVYKRLYLLNSSKQPKTRKKRLQKLNFMPKDLHEITMNYIIDQEFIYSGFELKKMYSSPKSMHAGYAMHSTNPVLAYAENPGFHISILKQKLEKEDPKAKIQVVHWSSKGDLFPEMYGLQINRNLCVVFMQVQYCHSYNEVIVPKKQVLRIASLDSAIALFYSLKFLRGLDGLVPTNFADSLVELSIKLRDKGGATKFPLFPVTCYGHQPTKASLLREKAKRVAALKKTQKSRH